MQWRHLRSAQQIDGGSGGDGGDGGHRRHRHRGILVLLFGFSR